jgi:hypothetical protein
MLLLLLFRRYDFPALVVAAVGTDAVRQHGFVALAAILDGERLDVLMTPPFALAGVRGPSLGDCHDDSAFSALAEWKRVILGRRGNPVKVR